MKDLYDLYIRYDGPLPRDLVHTRSAVSWEMMMRAHLRAIRLCRPQNKWDALPELTARVKQIRVYL